MAPLQTTTIGRAVHRFQTRNTERPIGTTARAAMRSAPAPKGERKAGAVCAGTMSIPVGPLWERSREPVVRCANSRASYTTERAAVLASRGRRVSNRGRPVWQLPPETTAVAAAAKGAVRPASATRTTNLRCATTAMSFAVPGRTSWAIGDCKSWCTVYCERSLPSNCVPQRGCLGTPPLSQPTTGDLALRRESASNAALVLAEGQNRRKIAVSRTECPSSCRSIESFVHYCMCVCARVRMGSFK
mmetsp:Transcript_53153/g.108853  ORF Transcript_53153/g.108853 Transcript_53153/m.108853 type:complete len:245 (+) Transcript_53153:682-1416(+)